MDTAEEIELAIFRHLSTRRPLALASLAALAGCATVGPRVGWTAYSTRLAAYRIDYELPNDGVALVAPEPEVKLAIPRHELVSLFAQLGYGAAAAGGLPPTRLSLGFGRMPDGPQSGTPSVERLGELVLANARATHRSIRYVGAVERVGKQDWFRIENHVAGSAGVQPEAVVYYRPLDPSHYVFVWGLWEASARSTPQDVDEHQRVLRQVVERTRLTP
jgi:hypothetical protein